MDKYDWKTEVEATHMKEAKELQNYVNKEGQKAFLWVAIPLVLIWVSQYF